MLGLDYSQGPPRGSAVRAAGYGFVVRYLNNGLIGRKDLTADEVTGLRGAGVAIALAWERDKDGEPKRPTQGREAGIADARAADVQAKACGLAGWPIYMCIDFDIPDYAPNSADPRAKLGPCGDYLDGAMSVLGHARMGVYGGYYAVSRALDAGLAAYAWQAWAWSDFGRLVDPRINLFQREGSITVDGAQCDVDEARKNDFGQQDRPGAVGGNDMAVFLKNLDDPTQYATQDGPLVTGVREAVGQATLKAWPGASCEIGLSNQEFTDRVNKSKAIEGLAAAIAQLPAQMVKSMPSVVSAGSLTVDQLSAAVAAGVRQALDGLSQTTVLRDKSNAS